MAMAIGKMAIGFSNNRLFDEVRMKFRFTRNFVIFPQKVAKSAKFVCILVSQYCIVLKPIMFEDSTCQNHKLNNFSSTSICSGAPC